jgi:hypothetical protein
MSECYSACQELASWLPFRMVDPTKFLVTRDPQARTVFANHAQLAFLPEEVYIDLCIVDLDRVDPAKVKPDGSVAEVDALAHTRVILSKAHAERLANAILSGLGRLGQKGD